MSTRISPQRHGLPGTIRCSDDSRQIGYHHHAHTGYPATGLPRNNTRNRTEWIMTTLNGQSCLPFAVTLALVPLSSCIPFLTDGGNTPSGNEAVPDFSVPDVNPNSARYQENVSPRDYLGQISAWYFGHAT